MLLLILFGLELECSFGAAILWPVVSILPILLYTQV